MIRPLLISLCLVASTLASAAGAYQLPFDATLSIRFHTPSGTPMAPVVTQIRSSTAEIALTPGGALAQAQLANLDIATTGALVGPLPSSVTPIDGFQGTFGLWPTPTPALQTFARGTSGRIGGQVRVLGLVRVCIFSPTGACPGLSDVFIPFAHPTPGTGSLFYDAAVGWQGTWAQPGGAGVNLTVKGAPWDTGTVSAGGGVTAMGFAYGPVSLPGSTARYGGRLNLVTPIFVSSSLSAVPLFPGVATLDITFTGSPPECANGIDDDGDGYVDHPSDPACQSFDFGRENAQCQDGLNNDGDGLIDFDGGASLNGGVPLTAPDPQCVNKPYRNKEAPDSCGLGAEIPALLGALALRQRRRGGVARPPR